MTTQRNHNTIEEYQNNSQSFERYLLIIKTKANIQHAYKRVQTDTNHIILGRNIYREQMWRIRYDKP